MSEWQNFAAVYYKFGHDSVEGQENDPVLEKIEENLCMLCNQKPKNSS